MRHTGRPAPVALALLLASQVAWQLAAASLPESIDRLLAASPASRSAFWGVQVVDLTTGKTLYEINPNRLFVPASNTKLFTAALALNRLGPGFTFHTRVLADSAPDHDGVIHGPLRLVGGGDPNLSARTLPYRTGPATGDPLGPMDTLAGQIATHGVTRIAGGIIGDDTFYVWQPYGEGWGLDDPVYDYGAPVSALTLHDNSLNLTIAPGAHEGDAAVLSFSPPFGQYTVDNRIRTVAAGAERRIHVDRDPGGSQLRLWGSIPVRDPNEEVPLAIEDPALHAARALRQALEKLGITVAGDATARHLYPNQVPDLTQAAAAPMVQGLEIARRDSAPLIEDMQVTAKVSQNLHAELALRAVGRMRRNVGSVEAGLEELKTFLAEAGIEPDGYTLQDGSGLSRLNLVTPASVMKLLRHMYGSPLRQEWISLLPIGGQDGTLNTRFTGAPGGARIHAKTGSLSHVSALSGYIERPGGNWVAFSILVNNYNAPTADIRGIMDRICTLILE